MNAIETLRVPTGGEPIVESLILRLKTGKGVCSTICEYTMLLSLSSWFMHVLEETAECVLAHLKGLVFSTCAAL